jgi:hypothetical protein
MARPLSKTLLLWTRTLHIYLSVLALVLLVFFSFTGFVMNHVEWFDTETPRVTERAAALPAAVLRAPPADRKLAIVEYLRRHAGARGEVTSFDDAEDGVRVHFTAAGRKMDYTIERPAAAGESVAVEVRDEVRNALAVMADLHKGIGSGGPWRRVIDATALLLLFASLSGLVLWLSLAKRRTAGLIALAASVAGVGGIYWWLVP